MTYTDQITGSSAYKEGRYEEVYAEIKSVISDETFQIARFASVACMLHQAFTPRFFWTGFYLVDPDKPDERERMIFTRSGFAGLNRAQRVGYRISNGGKEPQTKSPWSMGFGVAFSKINSRVGRALDGLQEPAALQSVLHHLQ